MPRRTTPHSFADYTNDAASFNESNLVDDNHYISLRLHNDVEDSEDDVGFEPARNPRGGQLTGVQQLDVLSPNDFNSNDRRQQMAEYERFEIRAPIWGPNKREAILLSICGAVSIITGVLCCGCGILDFVLESYANEASFQVESKFSMLVVVFGGLAACKAASRLRATSLACLFGFSLLGMFAGLCDVIMQCLNQYYVRDPLEKGLDIATLILSLIGAITSLIQMWTALAITATADRAQLMDSVSSAAAMKHRRISMVMGLAQCVCGFVITSLTVSIYAVLDNESMPFLVRNNNNTNGSFYTNRQRSLDIKWTLSSEMTNHGFLIAAAGISVALSAAHWTRWTQLVCLSLQGVALVTIICNHIHPLSNIYAATSFSDADVKISIVQLLLYLFVLVLAALSFMSVIKRLSSNQGSNGLRESNQQTSLNTAIKELAEKRGWKLYRHTALIQMCLASLYVIVWIAGFGEKFLYLLDFTPLPILILIHSVLSYSLTLSYSALLLTLNVAWAFLCGLYSLRDIWLFNYHEISKEAQDYPWPKSNNDSLAAAIPRASKLGVHMLLLAAALMEAVLAGLLIIMYIRTLGETMGIVIPNKLQHKHTLRGISIIGGLQLASATLTINFAFILYLSNFFTIEYLGDVCTFLGILVFGTGVCTFLIQRSSAVFLPLAAIMNIMTFVVLWQHTDGNGLLFSRIILYYKNYAEGEQYRAYTFSAVTFTLCFLCELLCGLAILGLEDVLIDAKFDSSVRVEMMVQNVVATDDINLITSSANDNH